MKRSAKRAALWAAAAGCVLALGWLCHHPAVIQKEYIAPPLAEAAEQQARGLYSSRLPLIPVSVTLDRMEGGTVYYTIRYFPFGTVGMSFSEEGLYNIEKPLTGL